MSEFLNLISPKEAIKLILSSLPDRGPESEVIDSRDAWGRIIAEDIVAPQSHPEFPRSAADGFAVKARDTYGATESIPAYLNVIGEVKMGMEPIFSLPSGSCGQIHTGGMLPSGADAVVMVEHTQAVRLINSTEARYFIEVTRAVAEGENIILKGEDVEKNQVVIRTGTRIRTEEIGGCMALGILNMRVAIIPIIGIISTGNELINPDQIPIIGQIRDINSYTLSSLISEISGNPKNYGIVPDELDKLASVAEKALDECNAVIITAGSSVSTRDITAEAINSLGLPGILVHGVNIRPGKPTILAVCKNKPVIGLPGNPVSALISARLFVKPIIHNLLGQKRIPPAPSVKARLTINVASQSGREDWITVRLVEDLNGSSKGEEHYLAEPIFGKSNLIFSLISADGLFCIPADITGLEAGNLVDVFLL
jgi:molybdopterin molybdotransferase